MNNTKKAQVELAEKLLHVNIDIDEVVTMSGLTREEVEKLRKKTPVWEHQAGDIVNFDLPSDDKGQD